MPGKEPKKSTPPRLPILFNRNRAISSSGSSGWEATTIGFTLVGCIGACAGLGYWLDSHFKTSYWTPILFFVGVIAGFREMFAVVGRINKEQERKKSEEREKVKLAPPPSQVEETSVAPERERIFKVPPPPVAGEKPAEPSTQGEPESVDELIARLLEDEPDKNESKP